MPTNPAYFPRSIRPLPDEWGFSIIARLAWANGFSHTGEFAKIVGHDISPGYRLSEPAVELFSASTGLLPPTLQSYSISTGVKCLYGGDEVRRADIKGKGFRYCAKCLAADAVRSGPNGVYIRGPWQWRRISNCPLHGCQLTQETRDPRLIVSFAELSSSADSAVRLPHPCDRYYYDRLCHRQGTGYLDQFPAYVSVELCEVLGKCRLMQTATSPGSEVAEDTIARRLGFEIASKGLENVRAFLTDHVATMSDRVPHPLRIYAPFLRWWSINSHDAHYVPAMQTIQDHAERHVALEPGEQILWPVTEPKMHNENTARREHNLSKEEVREIVSRNNASPTPLRFFGRNQFRDWLENSSRFSSLIGASDALGCPVGSVQLMMSRGYLREVPVGDGRNSLVRQSDLETLLKKLTAISVLRTGQQNLQAIEDIAGRLNVDVGDVLDFALKEGSVKISRNSGRVRIRDLLIEAAESKLFLEFRRSADHPASGSEDEAIIDVKAARRRLKVSGPTMTELMENNIIPSVVIANQSAWKGRSRTWLKLVDIEKFEREYVSIDELAKGHRISRSAIQRELASSGILLIGGNVFRSTAFVRRTDIPSMSRKTTLEGAS